MQFRRWRTVLFSVLGVVLVSALVLLGGGWYFSDQIRDGALKVDHSEDPLDLEVVAVEVGRITLRVTPETDPDGDWQAKGLWGLVRKEGYDQVGPIVELTEQQMVREYLPLTGDIEAGEMVRIDSFAFPGDPMEAHGIPFEEIPYSSPLGEFPAWFVPGSGDTWAIFVHGRLANPREALRMLPAVAALDIPSLIITYRNDEGLPQDPDGYLRFGATEWEDLEGAAGYALGHGAEELILVGYSMGGGIVTNFLYKSPMMAERVRAVVLDSPVLDFDAVLDHGASQRTIPLVGLPIPGVITALAKAISSARFGVDFDAMDYLSRAEELSVSILLIHGDGDRTVPIETSDALAKARPDIVRYVRNPDIDHVRTWNAKGAEYESVVTGFLREVTDVQADAGLVGQ